jgi:hypothetical protein
LIADTFLGQHPAPPEAGQQFLAHIITVARARDTAITNSSMASLKRRMKSKLLSAVGKSLNEKENGAWFTLVASEPSTSRYDYPLLEKAMEDLILAAKDGPDETAIQRMRPYYAQYRQEVNIALGSRQLFLTNGGVLGLAPIDTKVGDEVWVLASCATPVMLRKSASGSRIFLGEAYAHGVMHGEATDLSLDYKNLILE